MFPPQPLVTLFNKAHAVPIRAVIFFHLTGKKLAGEWDSCQVRQSDDRSWTKIQARHRHALRPERWTFLTDCIRSCLDFSEKFFEFSNRRVAEEALSLLRHPTGNTTMRPTACNLVLHVFFGVLALLASGCVSISLTDQNVERAEDVRYVEPPAPFEKESLPHVDRGWKNPKTGNAITFLSDCDPSTDPSLKALRSGVTSGLQEVEILSEDRGLYNGRASLRTRMESEVDGIKSLLDLMIFKKNGCIYILTYVGLKDSFQTDLPVFNRFLEDFEAP